MNEAEALALFRRHDDPYCAEAPPDFSEDDAVARFRAFVSTLEDATGRRYPTETEADIQDASFHSQIDLGGDWMRFSSFGDMVSIWDSGAVDAAVLDAALRLCAEQGYLFIPPEFTHLPYAGDNPGVTGIRDWWMRYFDVI